MSPAMHEFLGRMKRLFRGRRAEQEMADEMEFHQAMLRSRFMREGMTEGEAARVARRTFGDSRRWQERLREVWQFRWLENLVRDVRFSARLLRKSPGFTAVALGTLALGVGANTAVFTLINGLLLRPLPVPEAQQMAVLSYVDGGPQPGYSFCTPYFRGLEDKHDVFANVFAYNADIMQVRGESGNENVRGVLVSGQYFPAMQVAPLLGRYLTPEDDREGGSPQGFAVVISEEFWRNWFGRAPDVVGRTLVIANTPFTVVGVMPKQFTGADPTQKPLIYAPLSADPIIDAPRDHIHGGTHSWWLTVLARLQPGVTLEQANAALLPVSGPILHESTDEAEYIKNEEKHYFHFAAEPGSNGFAYVRFVFRKPLVTMFAMCGGILLLACLNLASLLLARGAARERELATRLAMGATRGRLVRQLLIESLLIAVMGTALGLALAPVVSHSLVAMLAGGGAQNTMVLDAALDLRVFGFAALIAVVAAVLIGLIPALKATGSDLNEQIKEGKHAAKAHDSRVLPRALMASQVALALVLVAGAGLLATSLMKLYRSGLGFDPRGVVNIAFSMDKQQLEGDQLMELYLQIGEGLKTQPGVKDVSFEFIVPLSHRGWNGRWAIPGGEKHLIWLNSVGPDYFRTMRIPMVLGREFTWSDTKASGAKIILNKAAAKQFFPDGEALGRQVIDTMDKDKKAYEVVAVVGDAKYRDVRTPAAAAAYVPIQQDDQPKPSLNAVLRVEGPWAPLVASSRQLASRLAPAIPAPVVRPMDDVVDTSVGTERMMAVLGLFFAGCALLVTAIGLYGTLAYATARRTSEIGIRMALGAQRLRVLAMVFRENAVVAAIGCGAGLAAAVMLSKVLASFLYETSPRDPMVFVGSLAALAAVACAASLVPALRAARIDPITAIRCE
jgi:predicted permease